MIKLNCGFSRKGGEANYGSRGASVNLELEIATEAARDVDSLNDKIRWLFALAKKAVNDELNGKSAAAVTAVRDEVPAHAGENGEAGHAGGNGGGNGSGATNKQVKLIMDLARTSR